MASSPGASRGGRRPAPRRSAAALPALVLGTLAAALRPAVAAGQEQAASLGGKLSQRLFEAALPLANQSLHSRFINEMADGTLPAAVFERYLAQDNLYLFKYARAFAALASKSEREEEFAWLMNRSVAFLQEHGAGASADITEEDFQREALPVTRAYTELLLRAAWREDAVAAYAAVLPCQRLYDWLFTTLEATRPLSPGNPYSAFVRQYAGAANRRVTERLEALLDARARGLAPGLEANAREHYLAAMDLEAHFFAQAYGGGAGAQAGAQGDALVELVGAFAEESTQGSVSFASRAPAALVLLLGGTAALLLALRAAAPSAARSAATRLLAAEAGPGCATAG